jgi:hypothetical protein
MQTACSVHAHWRAASFTRRPGCISGRRDYPLPVWSLGCVWNFTQDRSLKYVSANPGSEVFAVQY